MQIIETNANNSQQEIENTATRRKLRSHTRLQNADPSTIKSPSTSPLTISQENQANDLNILDENINLPDSLFCKNLNANITNINISELSSDDFSIEMDLPITEIGSTIDASCNVRRRSCRSQVQSTTPVDFLISDTDNNVNFLTANNTIINDEALFYKNNLLDNASDKSESLNQAITEKLNEKNNSNKLKNPIDSLKNATDLNFDNNEASQSKCLEINESSFNGNYLPVNGIKQYIEIKKQITKKRDFLLQVKGERKLPKNIQDLLIKKKHYLIKSNKEIRQLVPFVSYRNFI